MFFECEATARFNWNLCRPFGEGGGGPPRGSRFLGEAYWNFFLGMKLIYVRQRRIKIYIFLFEKLKKNFFTIKNYRAQRSQCASFITLTTRTLVPSTSSLWLRLFRAEPWKNIYPITTCGGDGAVEVLTKLVVRKLSYIKF
jgi:hypothetical protein